MEKKKKTVKIEKFEQELKDKKNKIQIEKKEVVKKCIELFCPKSRYGSEVDEEKFMDLIEKNISEYISLPTDHVFTIQWLEKKWNKKSERVEPTEEGIKGRKVKKCKDNFLNNLSSEDWELAFGKYPEFNRRSKTYYLIKEQREKMSFLKKVKYYYSKKNKEDDNFIKNYEKDVEKIKEISKKIRSYL